MTTNSTTRRLSDSSALDEIARVIGTHHINGATGLVTEVLAATGRTIPRPDDTALPDTYRVTFTPTLAVTVSDATSDTPTVAVDDMSWLWSICSVTAADGATLDERDGEGARAAALASSYLDRIVAEAAAGGDPNRIAQVLHALADAFANQPTEPDQPG